MNRDQTLSSGVQTQNEESNRIIVDDLMRVVHFIYIKGRGLFRLYTGIVTL